MKIINPILKGFNPDPSIVRAGNDYYIATSTFEWFPGVQIHHSRDLVNWELRAHPLNRISQLDMRGVPTGGGVWAPCLTYDDGIFYLVYTNVKARGVFMQTDNYLVTATDVLGEWSEPVFLNCIGFDPSLFHDDDGRKWLLSLDNHYKEGKRFNGLSVQEYSPALRKLVGERHKIYDNPATELVEGAHIYKINNYYYLLKAQGGTGFNHSAQLSRSESLFGPYEDCPHMLLTSRDNSNCELQKAGHADLVQTQHGDWYMVHLVGRPSKISNRCILGRETAIQKVQLTDDGWLKLVYGGHNPLVEVEAPKLKEHKFVVKHKRYTFDGDKLNIDFQTLREPLSDNVMSLTARRGYLRLTGGAGLNSEFNQSLIACRLANLNTCITACVEFNPESEKHLAGLALYYDNNHWYYLYISRNDSTGSREIDILKYDAGKLHYPLKKQIGLDNNSAVLLRARISGDDVQFSYSYGEDKNFTNVGDKQDLTILSDEYVPLGFTGTMIGLCCQDVFGYSKYADFKWLEIKDGQE